ncbi:MAG: EutN/CcmL family microcompartment protein [Candidatus Eisenbacteria bacterium]
MHIAKVIGTLVATRKVESLTGQKLLVIQPLSPEGKESGRPIVAIDIVRAGPGDLVYFVRGREAANAIDEKFNPADAAIMGIVDRVDL